MMDHHAGRLTRDRGPGFTAVLAMVKRRIFQVAGAGINDRGRLSGLAMVWIEQHKGETFGGEIFAALPGDRAILTSPKAILIGAKQQYAAIVGIDLQPFASGASVGVAPKFEGQGDLLPGCALIGGPE